MIVRNNEIKFKEENVMMVDSSSFKVFGWKLLVFTVSSAGKCFGKEDPVGKTLILGDE